MPRPIAAAGAGATPAPLAPPAAYRRAGAALAAEIGRAHV